MSNRVKIITCIYDGLFGSELGGRISRGSHYRWSLLSLLKMTEADFVCYTSEEELESLREFFYENHNINSEKLKIVPYNLRESYFKNIINEYIRIEETTKSDRCMPLQYMKFMWFLLEDKQYDYYYWFDAGLSHSGLIPSKYLTPEKGYFGQHYLSPLFNNKFLENLINFSEDKFTIVGKENRRNYWSGTVNPKHFVNYDNTIHVIGGFFGGKKDKWDVIVKIFEETLINVTTSDKRLYHEEDYMTVIFRNNEELFKMLYFDIWWHEDEKIPGADIETLCRENKSFYKILEELNEQ